MPSVTVHSRLADRVLRSWSRGGVPPFDPTDAQAVNAFRQGAFGPDLGYLPGGHRPLSDLAHCLRTGDLTRALLERARTPWQRAFAWGWVTHVLADTLIHPLVGRAVGELLHGSPERFETGDLHPVEHVRVEAGLDAVYALRHPELRKTRLRPVFDAAGIAFLVDAFRDTYGATPPRHHFLRSHLAATRRAAQGLAVAAWAAAAMPPVDGEADRPTLLGRLRDGLGGTSVALALLLPVAPSGWFLDAVRTVEEDFVAAFLAEYDGGAEGLENVNLDTGRPEAEEPVHGGLRRCYDTLAELGVSLPPSRATAFRAA